VIDDVAPQTDFYLKLTSEADTPTALAALYRQDYTTITDPLTGETSDQIEGDPYLVMATPDYAIDILGVMSAPTGDTITDADGFEYPETAPITGWHINIRLSGDARRDEIEAINGTYGVVVNSPARVWL
jgi:hypothetical protein